MSVDAIDTRHQRPHAVPLDGGASRRLRPVSSVCRVLPRPQQGVGHGLGVVGRNQYPVLSVGDEVRNTSDPRGDNRTTRCHRLDGGYRRSLVVG